MSTRTWDSATVEGCLAELAYQRAAAMRVHEQDGRTIRALEKRAARAERKLEPAAQPTWSSTAPAEPGQFWWFYDDWDPEVVTIERVSTGELWQLSVFGERRPLATKLGQWAGPLVAPKVSP